MARVFEANGGTLRLNSKVARLDLSGREAKGVVLEDGRRVAADAVIVNADFSHAMTHLVPDGVLRKYDAAGLARRKYSCSTFMLYLGIDGEVDLPHHTIFFSRDYRSYIQDVAAGRLGTDISLYVRNASVTDPTLAPEGKSGIYVLVPVPNRRSGIDWSRRKKEFRDLVVRAMEAQAPLKNLSGRIVAERVITPDDWETDWNVHIGATFNLAHTLGQMLHYRPRNEFEEISSCYLTGGGTHPGSGLPTIYESGRITANLISRRFGVPFSSRNTQL
jgi:phytoene desaturase